MALHRLERGIESRMVVPPRLASRVSKEEWGTGCRVTEEERTFLEQPIFASRRYPIL
jgi:hypothetical protein